MTTLTEVQDLAADLHDIRPDWDLVPIMNHLLPYRTMAYDELVALATAWAREPKNRTPASLQWMRGSSDKSAESDSSKGRASKEPRCYICGNTQTECRKLHDFEISRGLPDPHDYETKDQADANRSPRQLGDMLVRSQIRTMIDTKPDRDKPDSPTTEQTEQQETLTT